MARKQLKLTNIQSIHKFMIEAEKCTGRVTIYTEDGYSINGKSIMGIFSLDLSKPLTVDFDMNKDEHLSKYLDSL